MLSSDCLCLKRAILPESACGSGSCYSLLGICDFYLPISKFCVIAFPMQVYYGLKKKCAPITGEFMSRIGYSQFILQEGLRCCCCVLFISFKRQIFPHLLYLTMCQLNALVPPPTFFRLLTYLSSSRKLFSGGSSRCKLNVFWGCFGILTQGPVIVLKNSDSVI